MQEVKVNINDEQIEFLNDHHSYGFKDKSTLVRRAIDYLKKELEAKKLKKSADLYKEIYEKDDELKDLTNSAI
jgi:hypothetical protein